MKKLWIAVACAIGLGGGATLGGMALYNAGTNSANEKAQKAESEKAASDKVEADKAKKESEKEASEKAKKESEDKAKKAESEKVEAQKEEEKKAESEKATAQKVAIDPVIDNNTTAFGGQQRYGTSDPALIETRKQLLQRWAQVTGTTLGANYRLTETTGGFSVSDTTTAMGEIIDNGNGTYDFKKPEIVELGNGRRGLEMTTVATQAV